MSDKLRIVYIPVEDLTPNDRNVKEHDDRDVGEIVTSIKKCGFRDPIGVWGKDNLIVEGHGRLQAAIKYGMKSVPCVRLDDMTDEQRRMYTVLHNKLSDNSRYNDRIMREELTELDFTEFKNTFDIVELAEKTAEAIQTEATGNAVTEGYDSDDELHPSFQHNVFENQERAMFYGVGYYGIPEMERTNTTGDKFLRFMDWSEVDDLSGYIAHFYYDDYKFMSAWRDPDKYVDRLRRFKAVVSPDFSLYTDFPRALQILSCYRRQWCGAYWQSLGIDVIPDVVWGDKETFDWCFDGIPKGGTVAVSSVGVKRDKNWNNTDGDMFKAGYDEMLNRLEPRTVLFYGDMIDGLEGNIIRIPSFYEQKRDYLNERAKKKNEN